MIGLSIMVFIGMMIVGHASTEQLDLYGYFEPQYTGVWHEENYYQFHTNKLRVDLRSDAIEHTELGANVIHTLYCGKKEWTMLDFLPERITSSIPPEMVSLFQFTYRDSFFLDNAYLRLSFDRFALTVGKQQISLGSGYFANPTDAFNVKTALDPTYEQPGHNAIRMDIMLSHRLQLMALYSPIEMDWRNSGKLVRIKIGLGHFDISFLGNEMPHITTDFQEMRATRERRRLFGADVVGELFGLGVWGEGVYRFPEDDGDEDFYEFILGTDYTFESGLYSMLEYHHNSLGKSDYRQYDLNDWMRFFTGEARTISRDQLYAFAQYPATDLIVVGSSVVVSGSDRSTVIVPTVQYNPFENIDFTLMLNLYLGDEGKVYSSRLGNGGFLRCRMYF
nr:MAG: hypothetical protein AM324_03420 [Candidatus Thorarchaeota archaeon SMTZ1-83]